jgi:NAD(P)-dependent dehydrogenase (short-subunit alcohol dehydrogenase family)
MNISFDGKIALVTGAASGLGLATAKAFAESGASIALADWNEDAVHAAAEELTAQGHKVIAIRCDVADDAQVEAMVKQTVATFGRLDAAYNNAGVQNVLAETADTAREDYDRVMGINLRGEWSCMQFELQQMRKQGSGAIVNCSSLGGLVGGAERGIYHAAKHGILGFTKSAALEYAARGMSPQAIVNLFWRWYCHVGFDGCSSHSGRRTFITNTASKISTGEDRCGTCRCWLATRICGLLSGTSRPIRTRR